MHSQKEFKPIYGSFSGREAIEVVTKNSQKNMALKVPFNIGFPSIRRGGTKIKVTPLKPKDYGKEQNVSYSQAVMKAKQFVSTANRQMTQANKIITTQASSTVITNGNRSSTLVKPSITTQVSLGNKSSVNQPTSQIVSSISNKSSSANIQSCPSSPDKSPTMTGPDSHISNANNLLYNAADCSPSTSVNSAANFSRSIPNCSSSKAPINVLNGSDLSSSQQNNAINYTRDTKPSSLTVQSQQEDGFVNSTVSAATMRKPSVWNGVNSKVVNPTGVKEGSMTVRSQHTTNQHQPVRNSPSNKALQSGPNTNAGVGKESLGSVAMKPQQNHSVIGNTPSIVTTGKVNTVWNGINGSLKEQNILGNVIAEQSSSRRSSTSNGFNNIALKDPTSSSVKYVEQQESDNKNNALSVTSTPSSSRRSSESNGTNSKELPSSSVKNNAKQKKKKGDNDSKISSGLNTPSQSNTPGGSRRSSTSNGSNTIFAPKESIKNVVRQVELDSRSNVSSVSINTQSISRQPSESNGSKTTSNLSSSEKSKNNINSSLNLSSYKQPSNERPINENANMSLNSNGSVPSNKMNWAHLFSKDENQKATNENSKSNVTKPPSLPVRSQRSQKAVSLTNGEPKVGGLTGLLKDFDPSFRNVTMNPRGLINNGNMCFMNAILQTLSHCPPFCNLLTRIHKEVVHDFNNKTPLVDSLVRFIEEYKQMKRFEGSEEFGEAFSPEYVYDALRGLKRFDSMKGRQEDAEEFLGFLLGGLHEEFLSVLKKDELKNQQSDKAVKTSVKGNPNDDWMEVGRKNRTSYTRTTDVEETPISRIFCGQFRSVLTCSGSNSITLQPYQSLQLDIQPDDVKTIGDALKNLTVPEYVDDFYSPKSGLVRATKRLCIETLPPILTLHLKRFIYDNVGGTQKLSKHIGYSTTLSIQPDIMAHRPSKAVEYRLFGVVYHHGKSATGGHYTADILCRNNWLHIDDTAISSISSSEVASVENPTQPTDRSAYILFYMKN